MTLIPLLLLFAALVLGLSLLVGWFWDCIARWRLDRAAERLRLKKAAER